MTTFKPNTRVQVVDYGVTKTAVVIYQHRPNGTVMVQMEETGRKRWFHAESLTPAYG